MADLITVARPYADALYGLAKETGAEDAWEKALQTLAAVVQDPQAQQFLGDPERTAADKVEVLSVAEVAVAQEPWRAFLALLIGNDRWPAAGEIAALFAADRRAAMGTVEVLVKSAIALDAGQKEASRRRCPSVSAAGWHSTTRWILPSSAAFWCRPAI